MKSLRLLEAIALVCMALVCASPALAQVPCGGGSPTCPSDPASQPGSGPQTGTSNPIDLVTGNKYVRETDFAFGGDLGLSFTRHYNSSGVTGSGLGGGWTHSYETVLSRTRDSEPTINVLQGDGRPLKFVLRETRSGKRVFESQPRGNGVIEEDIESVNAAVLALESGAQISAQFQRAKPWRWLWPDGRTITFDIRGLLKRIENADGEFLVLEHDERGRVLSVEDAQRRQARFKYWDAGAQLAEYGQSSDIAVTGAVNRLHSVSLSDGRAFRYMYDKNGLLAQVHYGDGTHTRYDYVVLDQILLLAKRWGRDGNVVGTYGYDSNWRATYSAQGDAINSVRTEYRDPNSKDDLGETWVTSASGAKTVYRWRARGMNKPQLIEARGPGCGVCPASNVRYHYATDGQIVQVDRLSHDGSVDLSELLEHDVHGRLTARYRIIDGKRTLLERFAYASDDLLARPTRIERPSVVPGRMHTVDIEYTARGQVKQVKERGWDPAGNVVLEPWSAKPAEIQRTVRASYDSVGRLIQIDGPRTDVADMVTIEYDDQSRVQRIIEADGSEQQILAYDAQGRPTHLSRTGAPQLKLAYDAEGRLSTVSEYSIGDARTVQYRYDARGRVESVVAPNGRQTRFRYDAADRPTQMLDEANDRTTEVAYGSEQITSVQLKSRGGQVLRMLAYSYDAQSRLLAVRDGAGRTQMQYDYDNDDRAPDRLIDPLGMQSLLSYDRLGRPATQQAPDGGVTRIDHRDDEGIAQITAPNGAITRYQHNDFGMRVREDSSDRGSTRYFYDASGNLVAKVDARGKVQRYAYDAANRLTRISNSDGSTTLAYEAGRLSRISGPWGEEQYEYDARGRLQSHTRVIDGREFSTAYSYDADGRLARKQMPGGQVLKYQYGQDGRLAGITESLWWGPHRPLIALQTEGIEIDVATDSTLTYGNGLVTRTTHNPNTGRIERRTTRGVLDALYEYDDVGRIRSIAQNGRGHRYGYDVVGRLVNAETPLGEFDYDYDANGNRLSETTKHRAKNSQSQQTEYRYAPNSNRLEQAGGTRHEYDHAGNPLVVGERRYEYDSSGKPTKLFVDDALTATYGYNAWGERIKKVVYSGNQRKVTYFFYDDHQLTAEANGDGEITQQYVYLGYAPVLAFIGGDAYFVHTDHLGTPHAITDESQRVVWTAQYAPFGEAKTKADPDGDGRLTQLNLRFPGQYADAEAGTYYNYQRDYDPAVGRYRTSDPLGLMAGANTFAYVDGDPLLRQDPLGLDWERAGDEVPGWLDRIIVGREVHAMFSAYVLSLNAGYRVNDSDNGTFDGLRPDVYSPDRRLIWELKPLSNREEPLRLRAQAQLARYLRAANRPRDPSDPRTQNCGGWGLGAGRELFDNGQQLGFVRSPASGRLYRVSLYHDTRPGNTGLVFYRADLVSDPVGEFFEQVLRELANRPWIIWPPNRVPRPRYP